MDDVIVATLLRDGRTIAAESAEATEVDEGKTGSTKTICLIQTQLMFSD